ncbi:MAG: GNAT family N-acetyltransferase [Bacillota bacterium]|jgi:ribosomal protein S18 acetylase RimI-like enzyme
MIEYRTTLDGINPDDLEGFFVGWKKPLTVAEHYEILNSSSFFVLAYDNEESKVVGFINALSDRVHFAFIPMLEVLPEYQRKGIGSRLLGLMLELLEDIQCIDLTCDIEMQAFYDRFGMMRSHGMIIRRYLTKSYLP